ncbi:MAG: aromatic ring-hydroxylating dioxygenase subunit alpha [Pseudomonadota bacterium]
MGLLTETKRTLPSSWYYEKAHFDKEVAKIWRKDWVCVGHVSAVPHHGDYFTCNIGGQTLVITKSDSVKAYYNTCRHRGSILCSKSAGHFPNGRIICPYHRWTYDLDGDLKNTPGKLPCEDFNLAEFSLYPVNLELWKGFIFVNLEDEPDTTLSEHLGKEKDNIANWPLETLISARRKAYSLSCNWKIFWENYLECYHCPGIHPELCRLMPAYKQGIFDESILPGWTPAWPGDEGRGRMAAGAVTWTSDGQSRLMELQGLSEEDKRLGVVFMPITGSMYIAAHRDYVRCVRIVPIDPTQTRLEVDWLVAPEQALGDFQMMEAAFALSETVLDQDQTVCELNQLGIQNDAHQQGVLVPQEYRLWDFHEWLRQKLAV